MENDKFEELARNHPDLIQKSQQDYIGVGAGWFNIIDCLCGALSSKVNQARYKLKYAQENQNSKYAISIPEAEVELADELEKLPIITQIKEKFGTLRFYAHNCTEEQSNYINFAEAMSGRICEVCGCPGSKRHGNWIRVLCDKHYNEFNKKYNFTENTQQQSGKILPKIFNE